MHVVAPMSVNGKVAFITGGARGLGKAMSLMLLEQGAKVFFCNVSKDVGDQVLAELSSRFGTENVHYDTADVTDKSQFETVFKQAITDFGQVDIMINNAGMLNEFQWEQCIQVNLAAVVQGTKLATDHMRVDKGGKGGRIINISSAAGLIYLHSLPVYCATKHAVRAYTISLSEQPNLKDQGIEYAVLCPAPTATRLLLEADKTKTEHHQDLANLLAVTGLMQTSRVADALIQMLQMEKMNGVIQYVDPDVIEQRTMTSTSAAKAEKET